MSYINNSHQCLTGDQFIYWKCEKCVLFYKSDTNKHWSMDWCKCGKSAVDAEKFYSRYLGDAKIITKEEYEEGIRNTTG